MPTPPRDAGAELCKDVAAWFSLFVDGASEAWERGDGGDRDNMLEERDRLHNLVCFDDAVALRGALLGQTRR